MKIAPPVQQTRGDVRAAYTRTSPFTSLWTAVAVDACEDKSRCLVALPEI